jgi:hypothetical protein
MTAMIHFSNLHSRISSGVLWQEEEIEQRNDGTIAIAGFSELYFEADEKEQRISFHNPASNDCIMNIQMIVDGEVIYEQDNIHPGYGIKEIKLNKSLSCGTYYDCELIIDCFKDGTQVNGAVLNFDIIVR